MVRRFLASGRTGFYLAVQREGDVGVGDIVCLVSRESHRIRVADITRLFVAKTWTRDDVATVKRALRVAALPESWKAHFRVRLAKAASSPRR
jgi:MOSC domain-containing protein YiiM